MPVFRLGSILSESPVAGMGLSKEIAPLTGATVAALKMTDALMGLGSLLLRLARTDEDLPMRPLTCG